MERFLLQHIRICLAALHQTCNYCVLSPENQHLFFSSFRPHLGNPIRLRLRNYEDCKPECSTSKKSFEDQLRSLQYFFSPSSSIPTHPCILSTCVHLRGVFGQDLRRLQLGLRQVDHPLCRRPGAPIAGPSAKRSAVGGKVRVLDSERLQRKRALEGSNKCNQSKKQPHEVSSRVFRFGAVFSHQRRHGSSVVTSLPSHLRRSGVETREPRASGRR